MSLLKYVERMKRMDDLIRRKATGTPEEFGQMLGISKSMLMINLAELKKMGAPVKFSAIKRTYYYERECRLLFEFELQKEESWSVKGGVNMSKNLHHYNTIRMVNPIFTSSLIEYTFCKNGENCF